MDGKLYRLREFLRPEDQHSLIVDASGGLALGTLPGLEDFGTAARSMLGIVDGLVCSPGQLRRISDRTRGEASLLVRMDWTNTLRGPDFVLPPTTTQHVPLLTAQVLAPQAVSKGEAMRAMDLTWSVFAQRGAMADGTVTQGFCGTDLATLAPYSGPASCLWALRSLIVAFELDRELGLFGAEREPLPVELGDYRISSAPTGWTIAGSKLGGRIELTIDANPDGDGPSLVPYGVRHQLLERLLHAPRRPDNHRALYERRVYSTNRPVAEGCRAAVP